MEEPRRQDAKWNKPDTEGQRVHDSTYIIKQLKESNSEKQKVEQCLPATWARGKWELLFSGYRVSVMQEEKVLELCCITTLSSKSTIMNRTLKKLLRRKSLCNFFFYHSKEKKSGEKSCKSLRTIKHSYKVWNYIK